MNYLLDTCVISEYARREPNREMLNWLDELDETSLFLSAITVGEVKRGIELLPDGSRRKQALAAWFIEWIERFSGRIHPVSVEVMIVWGSLYARFEKSGQTVSTLDSLIAATALYHHSVIITRNENHFRPAGVEILNPWKR
jgi:tRNA(fMet)-specific endonuclease VapC